MVQWFNVILAGCQQVHSTQTDTTVSHPSHASLLRLVESTFVMYHEAEILTVEITCRLRIAFKLSQYELFLYEMFVICFDKNNTGK